MSAPSQSFRHLATKRIGVSGLPCGLPLLWALGCGPESTTERGLEDRTFLSERVLDNGAPRPLAPGTRLSLRFNAAMGGTDDTGDLLDPWIDAQAECNWWWGNYAIEGDVLVVTDTDHTLIGCHSGGQQEDWYFTFLESRPSLSLDGHALVLHDGEGTRIEYLDEAVASPDLALGDRVWTVVSVIEDGVVTPAGGPRPATFAFDSNATEHAHGGVTIETGCNTGSGSYRTSDTSLYFVDVTMSQHACQGEARWLEDAVLDLFYYSWEPMRWEITIDRLWLSTEGVELELVAPRG